MAEFLLVLVLFGAVIALIGITKDNGKSPAKRKANDDKKFSTKGAKTYRARKDSITVDDVIIELIRDFQDDQEKYSERRPRLDELTETLRTDGFKSTSNSSVGIETKLMHQISSLLVIWEWATSSIQDNGKLRKSLVYSKIAEKISSQCLMNELDEEYIRKSTVTLFLRDCFSIGILDEWEIFTLKSLLLGEASLLQSSEIIPAHLRYRYKPVYVVMNRIIGLIKDFEKAYSNSIGDFISKDAELRLARLKIDNGLVRFFGNENDESDEYSERPRARLSLFIYHKLTHTSSPLPFVEFDKYLIESGWEVMMHQMRNEKWERKHLPIKPPPPRTSI